MSDDNLKDIFQNAFAAEQVAFDPSAWAHMEALLNQKRRRVAFWWWFSGLGIFAGLLASFYIVAAALPNEVYLPRQSAMMFDRIDDGKMEPPHQIISDDSQNSGGPELMEERLISAANTRAERVIKEEEPDLNVANTDHNTPGSMVGKTVASEFKPEPSAALNQSNSGLLVEDIEAAPQSMVALDLIRESEEELNYMPILTYDLYEKVETMNHRDQDSLNEVESYQTFYVNAGLSSTRMRSSGFTQGFGQFINVGIQRQLGSHILISGEFGGSRAQFYDETVVNAGPTYGLSAHNNEVTILTSELLNLKTNALVHYRQNRLSAGVGLSPAYLIGIKNASELTTSSESTQRTLNESSGYYRWDRYRNVGLDALVDVQYQINYDSYVGLRTRIGGLNPVAGGSSNGRHDVFMIYLRINVK